MFAAITSLIDTEVRSEIMSSDPAIAEYFGIPLMTDAGVVVTAESSMRLAAVYSCVHRLSSSLAQMPLTIMRRKGNEVMFGNDIAAYNLLSAEPSIWQTSYDWREMKQQAVLTHGNAVTRIVRDKRGNPIELRPISPMSVGRPQRGSISSKWFYPIYDEDDQRMLAVLPEDVLHIKAFTHDKRWGISPIRYHAETIGLGLAAQAYGNQFFGSGGRPSGILMDKTSQATDKHRSNLRAAWKEGGIGKGGGRTALLHGDLSYTPITISPEEAQFLETRKFTRSEIAGIFNVPSHMINDLEKSTFSNISEQALHFVRHSIMPWVIRYEQEMNRKMFTEAEKKAGYYVRFDLAGLLRGTAKERAEFYHYAITDGWLSRNEVRLLEDRNPRDGLDEMLVSVNAAQQLTDKLLGNKDTKTDPNKTPDTTE